MSIMQRCVSWVFLSMVWYTGCRPGTPVAIEEVTTGAAEVGWGTDVGNSCSALVAWLAYDEAELEELFATFIPGKEAPDVSFDTGIALLSFTDGCLVGDNELSVDAVYLLDETLEVFVTFVQADQAGGAGNFRPYNVTWLELPPDPYFVHTTLEIEYLDSRWGLE